MPRSIVTFMLLFSCAVANATAAGTIGTSAANPTSVSAGAAADVLFTAAITDPTLIASSVNLQQLNATGQATVLGTMYDDGTHGDATAADGVYSLQLSLFEQGTGALTFRVSAAFHGSLTRVNSPPITVTVTGTATAITISTPSQGAYLNISPALVSGHVSDPHATVTVNGVQAQVSGNSFSASVPLLEGSTTLTAVAQNSNGSASMASETVTLDTTPPHVTIESPADNSVTSDVSVNVNGIVNDIVVGTVNPQQATVSVNGLSAQVSNRTYLTQSVPLQVGANTITATARDRAGNFATTSVTVTRQSTGQPTLRIVSGNDLTGPIRTLLAAPLVVQAKNATGQPIANTPVVFQVTGGDGTLGNGSTRGLSAVAVNTNSQGQAQVSFTFGSRAGAGNNMVQASAVGIATAPVFTESATTTAPAMIVVDSGNNQSGVVGQNLPLPFIAIVTDAGHNRLGNVPVSFTVVQGGGIIGNATTLMTTSDSDGRIEAVLTLGLQGGTNNNMVTANFSGNTGLPATFTASGVVPGAGPTDISGIVLDNSNLPLPGVTMRLYQVNNGNSNNVPQQVVPAVQTNAQGYFLIQPAPVGVYKLMVDGTTAARTGSYPTLEYDIVTIAGHDNTVGLPIYLPLLNPASQACVSATTGGTVTIPQAPGFALTIAPGSATFPGGSRSGCVSATPVNMDKVPMVPGFGQQPRFIVTIQPVGTTFNPPAQLTIPNVDGLAPRSVTEMYSYDHDLATFVAIGTGTVSADGSVIASDPGVGVLKAGWHCGGDPNANGTVADCPTCKICQNNMCVRDASQNGNKCQANGKLGICSDENGNCQPIEVTIQSIWSDQFPGVTVNGLPVIPGQRGAGEKMTYVLMGAQSSSVAAMAGQLTVSPDTPQAHNMVTVQVMQVGGNVEGTGTVSGNIAHVTVTPPSSTQDYVLVAGVDVDGNGTLDGNEILATSSQTYKVVPSSSYQNSLLVLEGINLYPLGFTNTRNLLGAFVTATTPTGASTGLGSLVINEACLSHNVGALFANSGTASIPYYQFSAQSAYADDVRNSATVNALIDATRDFHSQDAIDYFNQHPTQITATLGPWSLVNSSHRVVGGSDCANQDGPAGLSTNFSDQDGTLSDIYNALGSADLRGSVTIDYARVGSSGTIITDTGATLVHTSVYDLYDFDYDAEVPSPSAARVQAGFGTLGTGGRVYKVNVALDGPVRRQPPD